MTHQSHQTNGASLEDCHTNFFALTDLCGIKWRKFVNSERPNASSDPLDDPILRSYSRCMQADILCVWRRVQSTRQDNSDPNNFDVVNTSKVHPPLSLAAAKELWLFWYGEEPDLTDLVDADLLKVAGNQMLWNGTWERGLTYECRSLLFKALHNLMERFVLTKDIVRFGKWFVQPCTSNERIFGRSSQHLSFSFTFFVHGDTVCASIDLREHPAVRPLTKEHLAEAAAAFAAAASNANSPEQTSPNSPNGGGEGVKENAAAGTTIAANNAKCNSLTNNNINGSGNGNTNNNANTSGNSNGGHLKPRKVILAPFGMAATLTGNSYKENDPMAEKILEDWVSFFPLCNKENNDVPPVVEVIAGGHKMYHPSIYVLVTDLDDMEEMEEMEAVASQKSSLGSSSSAGAAAIAALSSAANQGGGGGTNDASNIEAKPPLVENVGNSKLSASASANNNTTSTTKSSLAHMIERLKIDHTKVQPYYDTQTRNFTCNTTNTHAPPQAACEMPERAWQDCITNSLHIEHTLNDTILSSTTSTSSSSLAPTNTNTNTTTSASPNNTNTTSGGGSGNENTSANNAEGSADQTDSNNADIKPNLTANVSQKQQQQQQTWGFIDPTQKAPCICTKTTQAASSGQTPGNGTPLQGGVSSYSRNSMMDCMPIPSVGSPGTPAPSPHPNSALSQPTSVPPADQMLMSPRAPTSVPNLQQPTTPIDHLLDKNTPAPTPTDQHDNKSITASPYVHPAPSCEAPLSVEGMHGMGGGMGPGSVGPQPPSVGRCTPTIHPQQSSLPPQAQQCGSISVKKFDVQPGTPLLLGASSNNCSSVVQGGLPPSDSKMESVVMPTSAATALPNNNFNKYNTVQSAANAMNEFWKLYKPPQITVKDIDTFANDDCLKLDVLYDFTIQNAWANHPVKRFKPNEISKQCRVLRTKTLYEGHTHIKPLMPSPRSIYGDRLLAIDPTAAALASATGSKSNMEGIGVSGMGSGGLVGIASNAMGNNQMTNNSNINDTPSVNIGNSETAAGGSIFEELDIKTEVASAVGASSTSPCKDSKSGIGGNLFTVEGLNPSPNDLEQLFETSSNDECGSVQIHTPPDSNNPSNGCAITTNTIEELKRSTNSVLVGAAVSVQGSNAAVIAAIQNCNNVSNTTNTSGLASLNNSAGSMSGVGGGNSGANTIQVEDLTKMFPTPPSHEQHHPNSSPCQMDIQMNDISVITPANMLSQTLDTGLGISAMVKVKQEYSVELGSPVEQPIEDWSYVFKPPAQAKFEGSSKYAPLTNLPSQSLAPLVMPTNCRYKPSWQQPRNTHQQQQQQQQQQQHQQHMQQQQQQQQHLQQQQHHQQLHELLSAAPRTPLQQPRTPLGPMSSSPMHTTVPTPLSSGGGGVGGSSLLLNQLNCPQAALTNTPPTMQQLMQRTGMSPISPANHVPFPHTSPMMQQHRQTPIHPPPPYEVAVASPALSTASSTPAYLNKQYHSQEPPQTPQSVNNHMQTIGGPPSVQGNNRDASNSGFYAPTNNTNSILQELPEVSSVIVNILLYDTALNVFRDHNFDSSTVCVCNADNQRIGNIRGSDSGVYVPLPGTTFNPTSPSLSTSNALRALSAFGSVVGSCGIAGGALGAVGGIANSLDSPASIAGAGSSSSTTPSTATPANNNAQQYITGYVDDDAVECTCGFSAVINRRLAGKAGLFYEDEMEITGIAEDPGRHKKHSLLTLITTLTSKANNNNNNSNANNNNAISNASSSIIDKSSEQIAFAIFDLLLEQCSIIQTSSSAIHRALQRHRRKLSKKSQKPQSVAAIVNILEYIDANDIVALALEQARLAFDSNRMDIMEQQMVSFSSHRKTSNNIQVALALTGRLNVHKWPYIPVGFSRSNKDIVSTMKSIQPMLQNAFHAKSRTAAGSRDATYTVSGPLTWRQFHRLAGRASGQCEPQPIPSVIVGHDKDWISVAPLAIHYWDKFLLEPYSYARDVVYLVIAPDNDFILSKTKTYFKELSTTYEMCKLGRHTPICGWNGLLSVQQRPASEKPFTTSMDNWLKTLEDSKLAEEMRLYAYAFQHQLAPYLSRVPNDKTLLNPPENHSRCNQGYSTSTSASSAFSSSSTSTASSSFMSGGGNNSNTTGTDNVPHGTNASSGDHSQPADNNEHSQHATTSNSTDSQTNAPEAKPADIKPDVKPPLILGDPLGVAECLEEVNPSAIVLYVVEPFTFRSDSPELERIACIALLRMYTELLKMIPDSVRSHINIQIISLESILELGRSRNRKRFSDEIKCLALNIFSQCKRHMVHAQAVKSLTGFGTAANVEAFLKTKDDKNRKAYKMYTPPYILAPMHEKNEKTDFSRAAWGGMRGSPNDQKYSVMYCNYCLSEDQSWLLATVTDDRGEMLEKVCINIDVPNRTRRRRAPARRIGLNKLMDYILGLISQTTQTWRLVVGRIGRIGHNELKSWSYLLGKQNLQKATKQLRDMCKQCQLINPPTILSACLVTLEPDAKLRVMPDQFTPDERFSIQNPLSTPQDVTCTHILVFPTSAVCLSFTRQFPNEPQVDLDEDFINFGNDEDENEVFKDADLDDLLGTWDNGGTGRGMSNHNSPDRMEDNRSWQSVGGNNFNSNQHQDIEEVGQINQQPLAVGYMVSTAPTGRMPAWFWSACPHLEDVCPVFLKTALHLHVPNIQITDDILNSTNAHSSATDHPLDSTLTADVLRYVLEGYNALSWLALDSNTHDRLSCLPINVQTLMDLYYLTAAIT
ncbi:mediator of RNA polymerase II transcription subunit 13 [Stomoxys calcitrans]|uniref:mediator of RNA polymerase II transcription subunit 13 n=1 Tax=Stomoxys calcitrans TaxID=35570 RepID=UPI0027E29F92|nr:mediator of RNA polymerase II transcription subunit 13 [Stomoxys calcitrans]XP_013106771.2 mediator of RNA polymerase II transcription subunit 13 [Stomoxys calcitrans]XP_013106774.2 mediator of RNA polymerase II transcription subunit 13 [Stomoxys calcitrans]XP_013106775.2 mediator of RNA polymerase II transcription subunit 13 [Stomoxys calcitrans]XP_013106776.2 mediator of RNA polymerase II transcription subunit 13 [Stomoxys calcitrans]XP_059217148.1 mediator of RNA polymerase II transcript